MKKKIAELVGYLVLFMSGLVIDRLTKHWILHHLEGEQKINSFLSFDFVINRGISWSMFHSEADSAFYLLTFVITLVLIFLVAYAYRRLRNQKVIIGEVLILAGGFSNIIDRIKYNGVIDFIVLSYQSFTWPVFNIADVCIVLGVFIMLINVYIYGD